MASTKDTFASNTFAADTFASGVFRGTGVTPAIVMSDYLRHQILVAVKNKEAADQIESLVERNTATLGEMASHALRSAAANFTHGEAIIDAMEGQQAMSSSARHVANTILGHTAAKELDELLQT